MDDVVKDFCENVSVRIARFAAKHSQDPRSTLLADMAKRIEVIAKAWAPAE